ncbi:hypothetical protein NE237_015483 [Protea cynaroides]|uniref:FAD-binding domain-containing protein n=1 Tax=Protea cynaroides TaxID=273540 RepID=A0A9Q0KE37_9MAGN|nr:hypothetical protein NE237_015483 [Protea cynaroides]
MESSMGEKKIVIIGGGICGLATALALHRKGIKSIVIEKAASLRTEGAGIGVQPNGWRALDQLGVGHQLRLKAIPLLSSTDIILRNGTQQVKSVVWDAEYRCLKRSDLIETMAENLPSETIRFGCQTVKMESDPFSSDTILHLQDGTVIKAKAVIGCDGVHSMVADWIDLKPSRRFNNCGVVGFTNYPDGHGFGNDFLRIRGDHIMVGRLPVDEKLIYWFVSRPRTPQDTVVLKEPKLLRDSTVELIKEFPVEISEVIKNCDLDSLSLFSLRHRAPWDILLEKFRKGTVTVAGDAMHIMGPFVGQGGAAALEDAVVLGRCLAQEMAMKPMTADLDTKRSEKEEEEEKAMSKKIEKAIDRYVKERRMRILRLSIQSYLIGTLLQTKSSVIKFTSGIILFTLFTIIADHTRYNCGRL